MEVTAYEGIVENGVIRLIGGNVRLPDHAKVYVIVPGAEPQPVVRVMSPRLAHPEQAGDFVKEVIEGTSDADLQ